MREPSTDLTIGASPEDRRYQIQDDFACACRYNLRGLTLTGRCPECGKPISDRIRELESTRNAPAAVAFASLGVALIVIAYAAWFFQMYQLKTAWPRSWLQPWWLAGAAGPHAGLGVAFTSISWRRVSWDHAQILLLCFAAQMAGAWFLTAARWHGVTRGATFAGWFLRATLALPIVLIPPALVRGGVGTADGPLVVWGHFMQALSGLAWGLYLRQLSFSIHARGIRDCGKVLIALLPLASMVKVVLLMCVWWTSWWLPYDLLAIALVLDALGGVMLIVTIGLILPITLHRAPRAPLS